jgi:hypothetical protein
MLSLEVTKSSVSEIVAIPIRKGKLLATKKKNFEFLLISIMFCDLNIIYDKNNLQTVKNILALAVKCILLLLV